MVLALSSGLLAGCTRDPNVRKQKYLESGDRFLAKEKYREAAIQYQNALQVDPRFVEGHYHLAQAYMKLGIWSGAGEELYRTLDLDPNHVKAHLDYGKMNLAGNRTNMNVAQDHARIVLGLDPNNVDAHILLANSYAGLENLPASLEEMQKAIQLAPDRADSYLNLALLQMGAQQTAAAEASFMKALQLDPKSVPGWLAFGNFYEQLERWDDAERLFRQAIQVDPNNYRPVAALARMLVIRGRRNDAEQLLQEAKHTLHDNPDGYRLLGDFYFGLGELDKASEEFTSLYRQYPKDKRLKRDYVQILILRNHIDEAVKLNDEILKENDKDVESLVLRGQILLRQGHANDAIQVLQSALRSEPDNPFAQYYLGVAFAQVGNLAPAETAWREAARLKPDMADAHQALARVAMSKVPWDPELLKSSTETLVNLQPDAPGAYILRAISRANSKDPAGAEEDLRHAMSIAPGDPTAYTHLGELRLNQQKFAEAEKLFDQALEKDPGSSEAMQGLILVYRQQKQPAKVFARLNAQIAKSPNNSIFQLILGREYLEEKDFDKAIAAFQKAVALDKNNVDAYIFLAQVQSARGSVDAAVAVYQQIIKDNPRDVRPYILQGMLEESRHNVPKAEELYQRALQFEPENVVAANNLAYLLIENGGSPDVALSLAEAARRSKVGLDMPSVTDTLAWIYYRKGAYGLAIDLLQEAVSKMPDNATFHYHLGLAYQKANNKLKAREHLQRALQIDPKSEEAVKVREALNSLGG